MRIAKCLAITLVLAAMAPGAEQQLSNTRTASCIVRITADPGIIPLNSQTVDHLLLSSAVAGKAARDVLELGPGAAMDLHESVYEGIEAEWLSQSIQLGGQRFMPGGPGQRGRPAPRSTGQSRDEGYDDMMRQLADIYGDRLTQSLNSKDSATEKSSDQPAAPATEEPRGRSSRTERRGDRDTTSSPDAPGMMMGGGGMGGMMGAGGMGTGGGMGGGLMGGGTGGMMGGGMGGMMGGGGMGGYGGGMMGGMYGRPLQAPPGPGAQQSVTLKLSVHLPEDAKPAAEEFLAALVENLKQTLQNGHEQYARELQAMADFAESQRGEAQADLDRAMGIDWPERMRIQEQLSTIVDLSMLSPEMPFSEAIETLRYAVEPPLQIVVLWRELLDNCEIEPTTPIDMDGLPRVKLETALRTLLAAVGGGFADLSYQIDDDVIVIREEELQQPQRMPAQATVEADLGALTAQRRDLAYRLQRLEMDFATGAARRKAIQEQIAEVRNRTMHKLEEDVVTRELEKLVEMSTKSVSLIERQVALGQASRSELAQTQQSLTKARIDLAMRREELAKSIGGNRLSQLNEELGQMAIDTAGQGAEMEIMRRQLAEIEDRLARASTFDPQAARIRIARQALDLAEARVIQLKTRLVTLQPPAVTVIGAN